MATPYKNPYHFDSSYVEYDPVKEAERLAKEQADNGLAQYAPSVGSILGGALGSFIGPVGTAAGSALGSMAAGEIAYAPVFQSEGAKLNLKRLEEIKQKEKLGMLGLTNEEKQILFNAGQAGIQSNLQQAQNIQRAAGAAGMASGAGSEALRAAQSAQQGAELLATLSRDILSKDYAKEQAALETKALLETAVAADKQRKLEASADIKLGGLNTFFERYGQENTIRGAYPAEAVKALSQAYNLNDDETQQMIQFVSTVPDAMNYFNMILKLGV